jgi:phage tail sheath gpL-like
MLTLEYLRFDWCSRIARKYPRHKLAADGTRVGPGQSILTPKGAKAEALGWFREKEKQGLVEGYDQFKADLVALRNETDPNRMDWLLAPDLVNSLIGLATKFQFRL